MQVGAAKTGLGVAVYLKVFFRGRVAAEAAFTVHGVGALCH